VSGDVVRILIVYATQWGGTARLAEAVEAGARREEGVEVRRLGGLQATLEDLLWCSGIVIATPENFGYMAGVIKDFFDRTFYPAQGKVDSLPYGIVVRAGNDGTFAAEHVDRIARGYPFKKFAPDIISRGEIDEEMLEACRELGQTLAAGLSYGIL